MQSVFPLLVLMLALPALYAEDSQQKIAELEAKLAAKPPGEFDFDLHNELRNLYITVDEAKSMQHVDIILQHVYFYDYMQYILGGKDADSGKAKAALENWAKKYPMLPHLAAACLTWIGDLETDPEKSVQSYRQALEVNGVSSRYREAIEDRLLFHPSQRKPWPKTIKLPKGWKKTPGPWSDPKDETVWPNSTSRANSDEWLVEHHDQITEMRPRLLLVSFANEHSREHLEKIARWLIAALAESTRYHGYRDKQAKPFLKHEIFKFVDLRDNDRIIGDSRKMPHNASPNGSIFLKYRQLFTQEFGDYYKVPDPRNPKRFLRLDELVDGGYIHEVWILGSGNAQVKPQIGAFEVVEEKPKYDAEFRKHGKEWVQAGNGGDSEQPWIGRSCRIGFVNASRGIGCFLESLAHGMEGTSNSGAIPYFTKYFREYADSNLNERYNVPFNSLYAVDFRNSPIRYPDPTTMVVMHSGKEYRIDNYIANGGSAHFPPNARAHYDLLNDRPVMSTIEDWRIGSGPGGKDLAKEFTLNAFRDYRDMAPDCMGPWLIYWRQNMPGYRNKQKADNGEPMKNWWPFLFY